MIYLLLCTKTQTNHVLPTFSSVITPKNARTANLARVRLDNDVIGSVKARVPELLALDTANQIAPVIGTFPNNVPGVGGNPVAGHVDGEAVVVAQRDAAVPRARDPSAAAPALGRVAVPLQPLEVA